MGVAHRDACVDHRGVSGMSEQGDKWMSEILSKIFDELKECNLRELAKVYKAIKEIKATTNERCI